MRIVDRFMGATARWLAGAAALTLAVLPALAASEPPIRLKVVGGLGATSQYRQIEEPLWIKRIPELSGGRLEATIRPLDGGGLRGQEILQLMRLGVVPFGTATLAIAAGEEPRFNAVDLPGLNPDMAALRRTVGLYRETLRTLLHEQYGIELLGIYTYPAQVIYCARPFAGLDDLKGRRIRTSSVGQSEMMTALGAVPVLTAYAEMVGAVAAGVVECAITGTSGGNEVGLIDVTSHIHAMAISWGLSVFGANEVAWAALPPDLRDVVRSGVAEGERGIWAMAERETAASLACNTGAPGCVNGRRGHMILVPVTERDEAFRRRLLVEAVLPDWITRCGQACVTAWNEALAPALGIRATAR